MIIILKPTLRCKASCLHCYEFRNLDTYTDLNLQQAVSYIDRIKKLYKSNAYTVVFHGGEPLLIDYNFYNEILSYFNDVEFTIQTGIPDTSKNSQNIISLIGKYSTSFEYPNPMHSSTTIDKIMFIYKKTGIKPFVVNVLWKKNAGISGYRVYNFYKSLALPFRFNILLPVGRAKETFKYISHTPDEWVQRLIEIFNAWFLDTRTSIYVEPLKSIIATMLYKKPNVCAFTDKCHEYIVAVNPDGTLYQCGKFFHYRIGHIKDESITSSPFLKESINRLLLAKQHCEGCSFFYVCKGGCKAQSFILSGSVLLPDPYCLQYKKLFSYVEHVLEQNVDRAVDWLLELSERIKMPL